MRTTTRTLTVATCALLLAGCSGGAADDTAGSSSAAPAPTTAAPSPSATASPSVPADVAPEALLPQTAWEFPTEPRQESSGVVAWLLPEACAVEGPAAATAMRTVLQGDGAEEAPVAVQQVALLPDADAAVAEADRLAAALTACAEQGSDGTTAYVVEPLEVGAQGLGLATDYYGASAGGALDDAIGSYLAVTRRGTAVTLVGLQGGESAVATARDTVTAQTQSAWALLCAYDESGC